MPDEFGHDRAHGTGRLLSSLLQSGRYRRRWERHLARPLPGAALSQSAIARVLAEHMWDVGEHEETDRDLPRKLKDRVHRALDGRMISAETLRYFILAFDMSAEDARRLQAARFPEPAGPYGPVVDTLSTPPFLPVPQRHRTIAVFERRIIGAAGTPVEHRTTRALLACEDGLTSYPYRMVRGATDVRVQRGGRVTGPHEFAGSPPIMEITLNAPLRRGQVASLEYEVGFASQSDPCTEYRRVAHARCENVDLVVQFDPHRRPSKVWWAVWDSHRNGNVLSEESVELDLEGCVHSFLPYLENAAVGFRWRW